MHFLRNKIPPPIVTVLFAVLVYGSSPYLPDIQIPASNTARNTASLITFIIGFGIMLSAGIAFRKFQTTVNPLKPDTASSLVTGGIFNVSRNPMYLGMLLMLGAVCLKFNIFGSLVFMPIYVLYMNKFQIAPEEEAMLKLFGDDFTSYKNNIRRWI